jgi:hypothetical protein
MMGTVSGYPLKKLTNFTTIPRSVLKSISGTGQKSPSRGYYMTGTKEA